MSRVLFLVNHEVVIYNFRLEIVERLLSDGHTVIVSSPYGQKIEELKKLGCEYREIDINRHGMNPLKEYKLIGIYKKLIDEVKPDIVFSYTVKPNIYGSIACRKKNIPIVCNITGLGTAVENGGIKQKIILTLYRYAFTDVKTVFFQNCENMSFFVNHRIALGKHKLLPGSGVNLDRYPLLEYPQDTSTVHFLFIGRLMKDKGIDELLYAAKRLKENGEKCIVDLVGWNDGEYQEIIEKAVNEKIVEYHGEQKDVIPFLAQASCVVLPSYHEGMANVMLEASSCGRPVITTNVHGCKETFDEGITGLGCEAKNSESLYQTMKAFLNLTIEERKTMGLAARKKMEQEFDRQIVVKAYCNELV